MLQEFVERKEILLETLNENMGYFMRTQNKLYETQTKFQKLEIHEIPEFGRVLRLDGVFQTSDFDEFLYHEPLVHVPAITINDPQKALIIGGGDGGTAKEILKYKTLEKCVMIELDEQVVEASKKYLPSISDGAFDDPRLDLRIEDGIKYIEAAKEKGEVFDQILLDLTDPFGPSVELYTQDFYKKTKEILSAKGVLSLHIESPISRPMVFNQLFKTLKSVFVHVRPMLNYVPMYGTLWSFALASNQLDPLALSKNEVSDRIKKHHLSDLKYYNPETHFALMALPNYVQKILSEPAKIATLENLIDVDEEINPKLFVGEWK